MTATAILGPPEASPWPGADSDSPRLLAGPPRAFGAEPLAEHLRRLGRRPIGGEWVHDVIERSGLRGRGGAWFPTHRKWRGLYRLALERGPSVVVINASEGEPLSAKDRFTLEHRPHLVIDGALIAAESLRADEVVMYLSRRAGARPTRYVTPSASAGARTPGRRASGSFIRSIVMSQASCRAWCAGSMADPPNRHSAHRTRRSAACSAAPPWCRTPRPSRTLD